MKKVIFSVIAMVAFVGSSMANDIGEVRNIKLLERNTTEDVVLSTPTLLLTKCDIIFLKTYAIAYEQYKNNTDATYIAAGAFQACVDLEEKKESIQP